MPIADRVVDWLTPLCAGSEMGSLVAAFDWASTSLGHQNTWPLGLRTAVSVCMTSRFPMMVVWGPDLIKIYNDGYRPMLGTSKHPAALGSPARVVWPEIWDIIGPMLDSVMTTGQSTWEEHQHLVLERNGYAEDCYFVYSYSPLFDDDGTIGGVLDVASESTAQVVAQRRLACLGDLSTALFEAERVTDVCVRAATALSRWRADVRTADLFIRVGEQPVLVASNRLDDVAAIDTGVLSQVGRERAALLLGGGAGASLPAEQFVLPIGTAFSGVDGVFVASLNPQMPFDDEYANFLHLIVAAVGNALDSAYRRAVEVGEYRLISDTLQAAMLNPASDLPTVAARYVPAVGNLAVGGDWYDVIDLSDGRRALVVGDCVGHGLAAATVMAQLRSATRAMLLDGRDPAATLQGLDLFAAVVEDAYCATVVCVVVDKQDNTITYSSAGHPPPLIVGPIESTWLDQATGTPLAVDPTRGRHNETYTLHPDEVIIMYSDGLIERRGEDLDIGFQRLATAAEFLHGSTVQRLADGLLRQMTPETTRDDVVLVVKQLPSLVGAGSGALP